MDTKQIIVMRTDLGMRKGKMVSQGAHAIMLAFLSKLERRGPKAETQRSYDPEFTESITFEEIRGHFDEAMRAWLDGDFTKICLRVSSEGELVALYEQAKAAGLTCALVEDLGKTEFHGVRTKTCCAIGPAAVETIDRITGHLQPL